MFKLEELAEHVGGRLKGKGDLSITGFCSLDNPAPSCISYLEKGKDAAKLADIMLGALVTTEQLADTFGDAIIVANPRLAFVQIMEKFLAAKPAEHPEGYIHERAVIAETAEVAPSAVISAGAVIEDNARIGANTRIGPNCTVGQRSRIGDNTVLYANVTVYHDCEIRDHCIIHSGTVIGADGFGFVPTQDGHHKFPQVGTVLIEDHVEIGANCCIDRAALDETVIRQGTKLDNIVQIAHGVKVGANTLIAAQTGVSGSTRIGNWCIIGGQVGFQSNITIGDQSIIAAQSGVFSDLDYKSKVSGYPAKPHAQSLKVLALTFKLPELVDKVKSLEIELDLMRGELKGKARRDYERKQSKSRKDDTPTPEA
jgi:UDP-3-O-[3-hydroxymyristoyl] glucosamine N-acyltransferase